MKRIKRQGGVQMAKVNFDQVINRKNTASVKWDIMKLVYGKDDLLPMWVADMDFLPPAQVTEAIKKRIEHGIYGYTFAPPSTAGAIQSWLWKRHQWEIDTSWIVYSPGVVPAIGTVIQALTAPGDRVMLQSPVYTPFFDMIKRNGRVIVNAPLTLENGRFAINFTEFEQKLKEGVKLFLLCNPHNPGGRVWTKAELLKIGELCLQYNCIILSDEIHSDLIFRPNVHVPIASLSEELKRQVITCVAPSKTFNIAGLQASAIITANEKWRAAVKNVQSRQGTSSLNVFGIAAMEAAYLYGEEWLEELLIYLKGNLETAKSYIEENIPKLRLMEPEGTYLLWIDCRLLGLSDQEIQEKLLNVGKLALEPGKKYGPGGEGFVRMNLGCPREILMDGLGRLKKAFAM
jgi:cystathionine beta-lyase